MRQEQVKVWHGPALLGRVAVMITDDGSRGPPIGIFDPPLAWMAEFDNHPAANDGGDK